MTGRKDAPHPELTAALENAQRHLKDEPEIAQAQCLEILRVAPGDPDALRLLAASLRLQGAPQKALGVLEPLVRRGASSPSIDLETGLSLAALGLTEGAILALRRAVAGDSGLADAWEALADQLLMKGDERGAQEARLGQIRASIFEPELIEAASDLADNHLTAAEGRLGAYLLRHPGNAAALRMLAETVSRGGRLEEADAILERCLAVAPDFDEARYNHATLLYRLNRSEEALHHLGRLLARAPGHPGYRNLQAAALGRVGDYEHAISIYDDLLKSFPDQPRAWMSYGHSLKTIGRQGDAIEAYRKAIALSPGLGEAWWSLANLKTVTFSEVDVKAMTDQLANSELTEEDRFHLHFALGKALEDRSRFDSSFDHYSRGAALRRQSIDYEADRTSAHKIRSISCLTTSFFKDRCGWGAEAPDPIFIVGLPRAGSTLIE
jgi:tetratricopeptide (TPR) repeat protein